jgi:hypothetical protein
MPGFSGPDVAKGRTVAANDGIPEVQGHLLVWDEDGFLYRVPEAVVNPYRLSFEEQTVVEAELLERGDRDGDSFAGDFIHAIPSEVLAPYRLSENSAPALPAAEVRGHKQTAGQSPSSALGYGPTGIDGIWGMRQQPAGASQS